MDTVEGVPKSLIHWSSALLVGILLFSLGFFLYLRLRERRLARERVVFMDWDSRTSIAWVMTAATLLLVTLLTYVRLDGHRWWTKSERLAAYQEGGRDYAEKLEARERQVKDGLWHMATPILAVLCVGVWRWAGGPRARTRHRGPARDSRWLLLPIAVTAGLIVVIGFAYSRAFWTPVHPHFDTSGERGDQRDRSDSFQRSPSGIPEASSSRGSCLEM